MMTMKPSGWVKIAWFMLVRLILAGYITGIRERIESAHDRLIEQIFIFEKLFVLI